VAFEPRNLKELLEWRNLRPGWKYRLPSEYLEELRRLCAEGRTEALLFENCMKLVPERRGRDAGG